MPLGNFISTINDNLRTITHGAKFYGISRSISRGTQTLPGFVNKSGEIEYVGLDDKFPVIGYHKLTGITTDRLLPNSKTSYGDDYSDTRNSYGLSLFIYLDQKMTGIAPEDYFLIIQSALPDSVGLFTNYKTVLMRFNNVILNTEQIFAAEYKGTEFKIPAEKHLFQLNYTIESTFKKGCFDKCPEVVC